MAILIRKLMALHWPLFVLMILMALAGIHFIESAVYTEEAPDLINAPDRQMMWLWIGIPIFFIIALIDYKWVLKLGLPIYGIAMLVLIYVLLNGIEINNSKSWISIAGFAVQPAEPSKIAFICGMTALILFLQPHMKKLWPIAVIGVATLIPMLLIKFQNDLGSAVVFAPIAFLLMLTGGVKKRYLMIPVLGGALLLMFCYTYVHKMEKEIPGIGARPNLRIKAFFDPEYDPQGAGWAVRQSLIAVGSGGLKGKGYKQGDQNIYGFLPRKTSHNDYIFPVIAEEYGFTGGSLIILAEGLLLWGILSIGMRAKELGGALLATGMCGLLFTHFFINVGMTMGVVPVTGIPLPFISYGGTFLVACMAGLGLVQSVWIHRKDYQHERIFGR